MQNKTASDIYEENTNLWQKFWVGLANGFGDSGYVNSIIDGALAKNEATIKGIDAQIESLQKLSEENYVSTIQADTNNNDTTNTPNPSGTDKAAVQRKHLNDAMEKLETAHLEAMSEIKKQYLSGDIQTEYEYNQALLDQQDKYDSQRKTKLTELLQSISDPSLRIDIDKQIADIKQKHEERLIQQANKIKKILLDADPLEAEKQSYKNRLQEIDGFYDEQLKKEGVTETQKEKLLKEKSDALELLEKQHQENLQKIDAKGVREALKTLDADQAEEEAKLAEKHRTELWSEGKYQEELLKLRQQYLNKKLAIPGLSVEQTENLNKSVSIAVPLKSQNAF